MTTLRRGKRIIASVSAISKHRSESDTETRLRGQTVIVMYATDEAPEDKIDQDRGQPRAHGGAGDQNNVGGT